MQNEPPAQRLQPYPDIVIRAARQSDAEAITTLVNLPGFRYGTLRMPFQSIAETTRRFNEANASTHSLVAELSGEIIGEIGLMRQGGRRAHAASMGMGVHDAHAGRGVGSALISAVIDLADNWLNLRRLELTVYTDNKPALALYRKFGFAVEGTLHDYAFRDGVFVDAYAMARLR
ncbi:GNAT family N-acetyltransferase [Rhizobium sp. FY34]|uniref:GNAT family N-acetyltransferase n=1 Tax=Rhizobium sp. FY34 TaxID=2562309 RepID=UPI0010BF8263|nr:GNAT family N-acetyltransferase [Rhizobium sp. FY34]